MTLGSFEREFQAFMAGGGFDRFCPSEGWERAKFGMLPGGPVATPYEKCKHGLTYLTCSLCYFQFQPPENAKEDDGA